MTGSEVREVEVGGRGMTFRVLVAGPEGGAPVLLLHGFPEGAESWIPQLEALAAAGRRAAAPDLRGYGGTDAPGDVGSYAIKELVADVRSLVAWMGGPVHLAGHDWGALVGWSFVSAHPDQVKTWTSLSIPHPVPLAAATGLDGAGRADPDQQARSSYVGVFLKPSAEQLLLEHGARRLRAMYELGPNPKAVPEAVRNRFATAFERPGRMTAALNYYRANMHPEAFASSPPTSRPIKTPTLLVWGELDPALGRRAVEETAAYMAGPYRLEVLRGAGHWLQYERPEEVNRLLLEQTA